MPIFPRAHYIFPYRERVRELVDQGNKQSHRKSSPAMILQILKGEADTNSKMLLLPTEHEVRGLVGSMLNSKSTRVENRDDNGTGGLSGILFDATGLPTGTYDFTYSVTATAPCSDASIITVSFLRLTSPPPH